MTPAVSNEEDTLQFFDAVIASCDSEPLRKPYRDDGNADVDFIGEFKEGKGKVMIQCGYYTRCAYDIIASSMM